MKRLSLLLTAMALLTACDKPTGPAPTVSVGERGKQVKEVTPDIKGSSRTDSAKTDSAKTEPARIKHGAPEPPKVEPPKEPAVDAVERITALQDPSPEQRKLMDVAKLALNSGDDNAAIAAFEQLQDTGPLSGLQLSAAIALADMYQAKNQHTKAIALLEKFQRRAPPTPELVFVLARAYKGEARREEAILAFGEALRMNPLLLQAHTEIGGLYHELGKGEDSAQAFLKYERAIYKYSKMLEAKDTHPTDKQKIAEAFSLVSDERAINALVKSLGDPDRITRLIITEALVEVAHQGHVPSLQEARASAEGDKEWAALLDQAIKQAKATPAPPSEEP